MASIVEPTTTSSTYDRSRDLFNTSDPSEERYKSPPILNEDPQWKDAGSLGNLYNEAMKNLAFTQIIIDCDTEDVDEKWKEAHRSELRELYPQHVGKVVTAQWYFEFFANSHLHRRYGISILNTRDEPRRKTPNCKQLYATILASAKEKDYGIVRIKPYQTNEEIEAWRWNHSRLLQEHHNIFEDVHEYMKRSGIGLSLNNTSEKEKEKKATGNNGVEEEERNEEVDVHMEWIRIELFVFQIIWHIAKDDKFPDVIQVDENSDIFFFFKSFALDLRCQIEKYFKIFECKEIEIEIPTELNCDNEKK